MFQSKEINFIHSGKKRKGATTDEAMLWEYLRNRTKHLNSSGIIVFRLNNDEATDPDVGLEKIKTFIESNIKSPSL